MGRADRLSQMTRRRFYALPGAFNFTEAPLPVNVPTSAVQSNARLDVGVSASETAAVTLSSSLESANPAGWLGALPTATTLVITGGAFVTAPDVV